MIDFQIKQLFFDRTTVLRAVDKAKRAVLAKAGAFIRTTAKRSIRTKKGAAAPGRPPHSHEGSLRRLIYFGYDRASDSVVVGPVGFKRSTAPNVLEFGGKTEVKQRRRGKLVKTRATIAERPRASRFMHARRKDTEVSIAVRAVLCHAPAARGRAVCRVAAQYRRADAVRVSPLASSSRSPGRPV